jgi:hypothetical protein
LLAQTMLDARPQPVGQRSKRFIEFFSVIPGKHAVAEKKPAV